MAQRAQMERLAELMGDAVLRGQAEKFKPPRYEGTGDVEYFLQQFEDCRDANNWNHATSVLHLRKCLEKSATECGRGATVAEISENLRARFSLTPRQARDRLGILRREPGQNLYELGSEVERLVRLSYPTMRQADRTVIAIDAMKRALDHRGLSRHLLAVQCDTVQAVVRAAEEYLQVSGNAGPTRPRNQFNQIEDQPATAAPELEQVHQVLRQTVRLLEQLTADRKFNPTSSRRKHDKQGCFRCGSPDHWKSDCPMRRQESGGSPQ